MKNLKKTIIKLLIIIVLIIITILLILLAINKKERQIEIGQNLEEIDTSEEKVEIDNFNLNKLEYLKIRRCLNQYISGINIKRATYYGRDEKNQFSKIVTDEEINNNICNLLSDKYKTKKNIDNKNVRNYVYNIEDEYLYIPVEIREKYTSDNIKSYGIYGMIEDLDYKHVTDSYLILNIDETNETFSVEQLGNVEELKNIKIDNVNSIQKNDYNQYDADLVGVIDELLLREYINAYKYLTLGYPEIVYNNYLDSEYKEKRFGSLEKYKEYVEENRDIIETITLKEYAILKEENYTQYIIKDNKGNNYIFNVDTIFDYKILLDNYTVDIPSFSRKYNTANDIEKGGYNIQKCIEAINNKDYSYVYNKLDDTFKKNNYETEEKFIEYIKKNLFINNSVDTFSADNEGNIYIYDLKINNANNIEEERKMRIIMQLKNESDFVMSFSF